MFSIATGYGTEDEVLGKKVGGVHEDADRGDGIETSAGGSNRQDSSRCRNEYHSVQNSGDDGFLPCSLLPGGVGRENP